MNAMYLIAHSLPLEMDPQPQAVVVASITLDPMFNKGLETEKALRGLAGRMGLLDFEIVTAEAQFRPGEQLGLPFPSIPPRRIRRRR